MTGQRGFTLLEMLVVLAVMAAASAIAAVSFSGTITQVRFAWGERQYENSRLAANAHLEYAYLHGSGRVLPPQTYSGYRNSPVHLTSTATNWVRYRDLLSAEGIEPQHAAHDGSAARKVRVYQTFATSKDIPMAGFAGETVRLTYDVGVIYQTDCIFSDTTCNTAVPGDSANFTSSSYTAWQTTGSDSRAVMFSTYQIQRSFWEQSLGRIETVISKIRAAYSAAQVAAPADQYANNFYPVPTGAGAANLSGSAAASNQYCYNGWYDLGASNVNVLDQVGLNKTQFSQTLWGGRLEYCSDFDPSLSGEGAGPHSAAIRINYHVTSGSAPSGTITSNRFFTF